MTVSFQLKDRELSSRQRWETEGPPGGQTAWAKAWNAHSGSRRPELAGERDRVECGAVMEHNSGKRGFPNNRWPWMLKEGVRS